MSYGDNVIKIGNFRLDTVGYHIGLHLRGCAFIAILNGENDLLLMNITASDKDVEVDGVDEI